MRKRNNVQYLRVRNHMSQAELAAACGVAQPSVAKWETGQSNPSLEQAMTMCRIFDCTLDDIYARDTA